MFGQTAGAPAQAPSQSAATQPSAPPLAQPQSFDPDKVAPNEAVVVVHGICPEHAATAKTVSVKDDPSKDNSCRTVITKEQFDTMLSGMSLTSQITTPAAMRNFAESYSQLLALAAAGEKAGAEKDPRFQELMRIARIRSLADSYRHSLEDKYGNPSQDEIEAYYKENISKYDSFKVERIIIPSINPSRTPAGRAEYEKIHNLPVYQEASSLLKDLTSFMKDEAYNRFVEIPTKR